MTINRREPAADDAAARRFVNLVAAVLACGLLWYAVWTATMNVLVLHGIDYWVIPWCLVSTSLVTAALGPRLWRAVSAGNAAGSLLPGSGGEAGGIDWRILALGGMALLAAAIVSRTIAWQVLVLASGGVAAASLWPRPPVRPSLVSVRPIALQFAALVLLLLALYLFGNRPDADDANYVNLAAGAQVSAHPVFAVDTMVGDGPHPIHLPTYRLHSFELLAAALSSVTGLPVIAVLHLVLPPLLLLGYAAVLMLATVPLAGHRWLAAAVIALGFLYANTDVLGAWGMHGPLRFFQGKGFLVSALVPLAAGLTARWLAWRQRIDLLLLGLVHACAVGFSANGMYVTPVASGFVAVAGLVARPTLWRAVAVLTPTLAYPVVAAAAVLLLHLGLPSEVTAPTYPGIEFHYVAGWHLSAPIVLACLPLLALAMPYRAARVAAALYVPLALLIVCNPLGWAAASAVTGNLGARLFWAIPAAPIVGLAVAAGIVGAGLRSPAALLSVAVALLGGGIAIGLFYSTSGTRVSWRAPDLRVERPDYDEAQALVAATVAGCQLLMPERLAIWATGDPARVHPVIVRGLYLTHYRFTEPARELALRWRLLGLVADQTRVPAPDPAALAAAGIHIGTVAIDVTSPNAAAAAGLARALGLGQPKRLAGGVEYWQGSCSTARSRQRDWSPHA